MSKANQDASYKALFAAPQMMRDLICGFVRDPWLHTLRFETLSAVRSEYNGEQQQQRFGDMVWRPMPNSSHGPKTFWTRDNFVTFFARSVDGDNGTTPKGNAVTKIWARTQFLNTPPGNSQQHIRPLALSPLNDIDKPSDKE